VSATIAPALLVRAIALPEFPTEVPVPPVVIGWAIAASATALRWVIAVDLAAAQADTTGELLVPAAAAAHPAWEVTEAVEEADLVAPEAVVVCAEAGAAGGKHHEHRRSHRELHDFELALAKTSRRCRDRISAAHPGADLRILCRRANTSCET
jgi:hypothetical protein